MHGCNAVADRACIIRWTSQGPLSRPRRLSWHGIVHNGIVLCCALRIKVPCILPEQTANLLAAAVPDSQSRAHNGGPDTIAGLVLSRCR